MIENYNDLISAIILVLIPLLSTVIFFTYYFGNNDKDDSLRDKTIEYYKEW